MLVNLKAVLKDAQEKQYAVGAFNMTVLESALAIEKASSQLNSPVIIQISEKTINYMGIEVAYAIAKAIADRSRVPVVIHLDHGRNLEIIDQAIKIGFSSVMLDVSHLPLKERIPLVRRYVKIAHKQNISVEAEEDMIGGREDYVVGQRCHFTDPSRARIFVSETGIDALAVSIGSVHGTPVPGEKLDLELLSQIHQQVAVPLVLHGASATPDSVIRQAIARGICKINIDTDLRLAFTRVLKRVIKDKEVIDPRDELKPSIEEITQTVKDRIEVFGSAGANG